jgi:hypothetical protein
MLLRWSTRRNLAWTFGEASREPARHVRGTSALRRRGRVRRADDPKTADNGDVREEQRRARVAVAGRFLDGPDIPAGLRQVRGERMPQRLHRDRLGQPGPGPRIRLRNPGFQMPAARFQDSRPHPRACRPPSLAKKPPQRQPRPARVRRRAVPSSSAHSRLHSSRDNTVGIRSGGAARLKSISPNCRCNLSRMSNTSALRACFWGDGLARRVTASSVRNAATSGTSAASGDRGAGNRGKPRAAHSRYVSSERTPAPCVTPP